MRLMTTAILLLFVLPASGQDRYKIEGDPTSPTEIPYQRYFTRDRFDRRITFYITTATTSGEKAPLVISILGSGSHSNFIRVSGRIYDGHVTIRRVLSGRAHLLFVEKPGVEFLEQPSKNGLAEGSSKEFRREHTLERWAEAVSAAIRAARTLPFVDANRTLVVGHSEGAHVASRLAADDGRVTHVASLAGGGVNLLFGLMESARRGYLHEDISDEPEERVGYLQAGWKQVQQEPDSTSKLFLGHPHRYWSSFLRSSCLQELLKTKARIYIAHGTEDHADPVTSFDVMHAYLLANGKDVTSHRVGGANHAFGFATEPSRDGLKEEFERVLTWFFQGAKRQ